MPIQPQRPIRLRRWVGPSGALALLPLAVWNFEVDPLGSVLSIVLLVVSLGVHEFAHAWTAWKCGDPTAKEQGRLTLNPIAHIDPFWTLVLPAFLIMVGMPVFGGAKPVPVNFHRLRNPWRDMTLVALAGPASNLVLALFFLALAKFFVSTGYYNDAAPFLSERWDDLLPRVFTGAALTNVILFVFNIIPIPPLDGSRLMEHVLPASARASYLALGSFGLIVIYGLMQVPAFRAAYSTSVSSIFDFFRQLLSVPL